MKKLLLSIVALMATVAMNAQTEVVFDFDKDATALFGIEGRSSGSNDTYVAAGEFNEDGVATVDGVTIIVKASAADAQTRNRLWTSSPVLRMYNESLTVKAEGHKVTKIEFVAGSNFNIASVSAGTLEAKTWVADSEVSSVVFNIQKNTQLKQLKVTLDGNLGDGPDPVVLDGKGEGTETSPYDIARALSIIKQNVMTSENVYVVGIVSSVKEVSAQYGNATYNLSDDGKAENELVIFRGKYLNGEKFTSEDQINVGDVVVVCGKLVDYNGTPEVTTGSSIISINANGDNIKGITTQVDLKVYDLTGRQSNTLRKGINIVNGKKFIVK